MKRLTKRPPILPALLAAAAMSACSAGLADAENKTYSLSGFKEIHASAGVKVSLKQGPFSIHAESTSGDLDNLLIELKGDTLVIGRKNTGWNWSFNDHFKVSVSAPEITNIRASSGADVEAASYTFRDLDVEVSSGADIELAGACAALNVRVSSGADFSGEELKCETATARASSGADADVFASRSGRGDASSGGDVTIHGNPASFEKDTSSGGSVRKSS